MDYGLEMLNFDYISREIENNLKQKKRSNRAEVLFGPRQVGKSTLLAHIMENQQTHLLTGDDENDVKILSDPSTYLPLLKDYPNLVIDEAQYIPSIGRVIKRMVDNNETNCHIFVTGSCSLDLAGGVMESAAGRINTYSKLFAWAESDVDGEGSWAFDGWEESGNNLFNVGAGVSKAWDRLILSGRLDGFLMSSHIYANATAQLKYFPLEDGRTSITVTGSVGSAPEANLIDNAMPGTFDKLNSMVGLGGIYMINKHLSVGLMGTWQTFYSQVNQRGGDAFNYTEWLNTKYRNLYNVHVQFYVHF